MLKRILIMLHVIFNHNEFEIYYRGLLATEYELKLSPICRDTQNVVVTVIHPKHKLILTKMLELCVQL